MCQDGRLLRTHAAGFKNPTALGPCQAADTGCCCTLGVAAGLGRKNLWRVESVLPVDWRALGALVTRPDGVMEVEGPASSSARFMLACL